MANFVVLDGVNNDHGWTPINHMMTLLADYFDAPIVNASGTTDAFNRVLYAVKSRRRNADKPDAILVAPTASDILNLCKLEGINSRFNRIVVWLIDSPHTEMIPRQNFAKIVDHIFITSYVDLAEHQSRMGVSVSVLARGADVLGLGVNYHDKSIDVLRLGRQPLTWDDDERNESLFSSLNDRYVGRPPVTFHESNKHAGLMLNYLSKSKFVIAQSNLKDHSKHTHSTKEYFTERWLDSLACGAVVAGVAPTTDPFYQQHLWSGALLELYDDDVEKGVREISQALAHWDPSISSRNHHNSLIKLDWRHRFKGIADYFDVTLVELERSRVEISNRWNRYQNKNIDEAYTPLYSR